MGAAVTEGEAISTPTASSEAHVFAKSDRLAVLSECSFFSSVQVSAAYYQETMSGTHWTYQILLSIYSCYICHICLFFVVAYDM